MYDHLYHTPIFVYLINGNQLFETSYSHYKRIPKSYILCINNSTKLRYQLDVGSQFFYSLRSIAKVYIYPYFIVLLLSNTDIVHTKKLDFNIEVLAALNENHHVRLFVQQADRQGDYKTTCLVFLFFYLNILLFVLFYSFLEQLFFSGISKIY